MTVQYFITNFKSKFMIFFNLQKRKTGLSEETPKDKKSKKSWDEKIAVYIMDSAYGRRIMWT